MLTPEICYLPADKLMVDPAIQRSLDPRRAAKIAAEYDPEALGTLTVSLRDNGNFHIVNGQHRWTAARMAVGESAELPCQVYTGLSPEDEARLFRLHNATTKPQAIDLFRVRVIEGDKAATEIDQIIRGAGWDIALNSGPHTFSAVAAADRLYKLDPAAVEKSIVTITKAWGHDEADGRVFEGLGLLYRRYGDAVNLSALVDRLSAFSGGQRNLLGTARGAAVLLKVTVPRAVAGVAVQEYNARRKSRALPSWHS